MLAILFRALANQTMTKVAYPPFASDCHCHPFQHQLKGTNQDVSIVKLPCESGEEKAVKDVHLAWAE